MPLLSQNSPAFSALIKHIQAKLPAAQAVQVIKFVTHHYSSIADEELAEHPLEDLYASVLLQWQTMAQRSVSDISCRIENPTLKTHGWQSPHTIITLCQTDRPFLVDSMLVALARLGIHVHFLVHCGCLPVQRDAAGKLVQVFAKTDQVPKEAVAEAVIYVEIDRQVDDPKVIAALQQKLIEIMQDVKVATNDYPAMRERLASEIQRLRSNPAKIDATMLDEYLEFLSWIDNDHFTFLGQADVVLPAKGSKEPMHFKPGSGLGLFRHQHWLDAKDFADGFLVARDQIFSSQPILVSKSALESTVHRGVKLDVISIKQFDQGKVVGETRFIGLYTSAAYHSDVMNIPMLRHKAERVIQRSGYSLKGHDGKTLLNVLDTFPRDELFQIGDDELFDTAIRIMQIQERNKVRFFIRKETFGRYYYCMVFLPKDAYNSDVRLKMQQLLMTALRGKTVTYEQHLLESILCRVDFIITVDPTESITFDVNVLEQQLIQVAHDWQDQLKTALTQTSAAESNALILYHKYQRAFAVGYRADYSGEQAASDIVHIEQLLQETEPLSLYFYRESNTNEPSLRLKVFHKNTGLPLTTVLPILENMGLKVLEERPYEIKLSADITVWMSDFELQLTAAVDLAAIESVFTDAFVRVWLNQAENDGFNRLIAIAGLSWHEVRILRACARYWVQIGCRYSQPYIENALADNAHLARLLVALFVKRFDPAESAQKRQQQVKQIHQQLTEGLAKVTNLDHDRIIQSYIHIIGAILRTNHFQRNAAGQLKEWLSFKLQPAQIPDMPKPTPKFEIFVFSRSVEGVHLRMSSVARGGLRWSDRYEDFRTEVLSLMKAQQVKNAVIVPMGAKGGFVAKCLSSCVGRDQIQQEGVSAYKTFIRGLLDITDNVVAGKIIAPKEVVCYDEEDPYFVVAADKGTATFSDIANSVSAEYGFWLGDAFASGGSNGYDHKKMAITARGAWEAVKRNFLSIGRDVQTEPFTVVGVGDMSGDVFGNGMLLSPQIRLLAVFNHQHIFIDPNPDVTVSLQERQRLFNLPRSTWADYNRELISQGGGVFERQAKVIELSVEACQALGLEQNKIEPSELIQAILKAPVDLLWNGGIGTYIKASTENHFEVGDRQNDAVRVDATELRCKVIGEGGNLGVTQRGRIEFALRGGLINTDAIDNSAGVDCSDHEVNIKILLNDLLAQKLLTAEQRNPLLASMQEEVSTLVLRNNYDQTQTIRCSLANDSEGVDIYARLISELVREAGLDRRLEMIPSDKELQARRINGQGLTAPEFAVLMAYTKLIIRRVLLGSKLPDDPYFFKYLRAEFPECLATDYSEAMKQHRLAREIIAAQVTNTWVKYMGIDFVHRLYDQTGATVEMIIRAFEVMLQVFSVPTIWHHIEKLDGKVPAPLQYQMMQTLRRSLRRSVRWLVRHCRENADIMTYIEVLSPQIAKLRHMQVHLLDEKSRLARQERLQQYHEQGVPKALASQIIGFDVASPVFDVIEISLNNELPLEKVAAVYGELNQQLSLAWLRECLLGFAARDDYWEILSSSALRDDLDRCQSFLTRSVLESTAEDLPVEQRVTAWIEHYRFIVRRWLYQVDEFKLNKPDLVKLITALRSLSDMMETVKVSQNLRTYRRLATFAK